MGKPTGFMEFERIQCSTLPPSQRVESFEEFHRHLSEETRRCQGGRCMDCGTPLCQSGISLDGRLLGCPLHNLIPEWNDLLWRNHPELALARLLKTNCFPEFTGRICPAPCERACTLGYIGDPVTVRENELYIIEAAFEKGLMRPAPPTSRSGRSVAVVGSGPAGLSAAWWLNRSGHSVTVFERDSEPGGLLRYGIPPMKLPKDIVNRRVALAEAEGIVFKTGVNVGSDISVSELHAAYDCIIFCCGAQKPRTVSFEGEAAGIGFALDYLRKPDGKLFANGKAVAVIGAGDSASDCIATAIRQGASSIAQIIRKPSSFYTEPADYAHEEALAVLGRDIRIFESRLSSVHSDENGELCAITVSSPEGDMRLPAQRLYIASGFSGSNAGFEVPATSGIFTAGDMRNGASLVVLAIADGKRAAAEAEQYMLGYTKI